VVEQRSLAQGLASTVVVTDLTAALTERPMRSVLSPKHHVHLTPHVLIFLNVSKIIDLSSLDVSTGGDAPRGAVRSGSQV
jgi:hypothetical protein